MAKKNKDKESCDAFFYFNLGKVFKKFDDFNSFLANFMGPIKTNNNASFLWRS